MNNTLQIIIAEIGKALMPVKKVISSPDAFFALMRDMGYNLEAIPEPLNNLVTSIDQLIHGLIHGLSEGADIADVRSMIEDVKSLIDDITDLKNQDFRSLLDVAGFVEEFPLQLLDYLLIQYLRRRHPKVAYAFEILGIIRISYQRSDSQPPHMKKEIVWANIPRVLTDPVGLITETYGWGTENFAGQLVLQRLLDLMLVLRMQAYLAQSDATTIQKLGNGAEALGNPIQYAVIAPFYESNRGTEKISIGLKFMELLGGGDHLPGLALIPYAKGEFSEDIQLTSKLVFSIQTDLDMNGGIGIKLRPNTGFEIIAGLDDPEGDISGVSGNLEVGITSAAGGEFIALIGSVEGSGLMYKAFSLKGGIYLDSTEFSDVYYEMELVDGKVQIKPDEGDGFINNILPADGIAADISLAMGLSLKRGFYFRGSGGLEINLPTQISLGPIELLSTTIKIDAQPENRVIPIDVGASISGKLGPLVAVVENLGLTFKMSFPEEGGELGPLDLDLAFKPPSGVGLSIDAGGFVGGGILSFYPDEGRYQGFFELEFKDLFSISVLALITTRMPDGADGFSLLLIVSTEFTPVQLGFGFTLNGVGGLLGLNRTMQLEVLKEGLKNDTLDNILFPENVVENAPRIISDLRLAFPPEEGVFLIGPMAKIGWGSPSIITLEMGLIIEIPGNIAILGVIRALLPKEEDSLLRIQVNFLGYIDFDNKIISFDAELFDSRLLTMTLEGSMALRLSWGDQPNFLLSVGGFHPAYEPPPLGLEDMNRLSINLFDGENPRLSLEAYFAITSNTVQFGARADLYFSFWELTVEGFMSFDALFQFSPFYFSISIGFMISVKAFGWELLGVHLDFTLEGPTPWRVSGIASFTFLLVDHEVDFDRTFGREEHTELPDVAVLPLLVEALENKDNWSATLPARNSLSVMLREIPEVEEELIIHSAATLTVNQKIVPLNFTLEKYGHQKPADANHFEIASIGSNGDPFSLEYVKEFFAPAQFEQLTDQEKLSRKSFEKLDSGVRITPVSIGSESGPNLETSGGIRTRAVEHEEHIIDIKFRFFLTGLITMALSFFNAFLKRSATYQYKHSFYQGELRRPYSEKIEFREEGFTYVFADALRPVEDQVSFTSEAEAYQAMDRYIANHPEMAGEVLVVSNFEMMEAEHLGF